MPTIDREARNAVALEVRRFLDGETTAFAFDEAIQDIESDDPTVRDIIHRLWHHYDDCKDHAVVLAKPEWNYFQRLLLILESDRHIESKTSRRWCWSQLPALVALLAFATFAVQVGIGSHLLMVSIPFGFASMLIAYMRQHAGGPQDSFVALTPFASFAELWDTYYQVDGFKKQPFPRDLEGASIRSDAVNRLLMTPSWIAWLIFAPIVLLVQSLPERDRVSRVVSSG